nr:hypothetical protein BaRGS_020325 [Batillaria attramentaria]
MGWFEAEILQHSDIPVISAEAVSMEDVTVDVGSTALNFPLIKVHGSLMMVAWIFAASIGIVMARYFKTITGETYKKAHPILGIIVTALCVINPIMALFRPHPNTPNRPIFNWAHWAVGTAAHIMGVVTIFFGVRLEKSAAPDYIIYVLVAFVAWQFLIHLLLELTQCVGRNSDRSDMYEMSSPGSHTKPASSGEQSTFAKQLLLGTHMLVVTGFIIALLVILNIEDDHDH